MRSRTKKLGLENLEGRKLFTTVGFTEGMQFEAAEVRSLGTVENAFVIDIIMAQEAERSESNEPTTVDELDPRGTSEESGSGGIIIYRDHSSDIEATSETVGNVMAGPDGQGDYRGPWSK